MKFKDARRANGGVPQHYVRGQELTRSGKTAAGRMITRRWKVARLGRRRGRRIVLAFRWIESKKAWAKSATWMESYEPENGDTFSAGGEWGFFK